MISTFVEDHLLLSGCEPARRSSRRGCWPRTFGFTWSMVLLDSRHRICIVDILYTKHFVWNALPEERAAGCRQSVGAAWSSSSLEVPPDAGSLLRLPPLLDGPTLCDS